MEAVSSNQAIKEPAHDILAAEAFAVPTADPGLRRGLVLPEDPAGIAEPHDILAAEEFAMPAPDHHPSGADLEAAGTRGLSRWAWVSGACLAALWMGWRRRG